MMGLESSKNGRFQPFLYREQNRKISPPRDRKAREKSFMKRSNLPLVFFGNLVEQANGIHNPVAVIGRPGPITYAGVRAPKIDTGSRPAPPVGGSCYVRAGSKEDPDFHM